MNRVFVYGSLKRDGARHDLLKGAVFVGKAATVTPFRMLDGPYPVLRDIGPDAHRIAGEIYEVDERMLAALDDYEGVGKRLYDRVEIDVAIAHETPITRALIYIGCGEHWDSQALTSYVALDEKGHLDWTPPQAR